MVESTTMNPLQEALESATGPVLDLVDARFHQNGFLPPAEPFTAGSAAYFAKRAYAPHSKGSPQARASIAAYYRDGGPVSSGGLALDPEHLILTASTSESYSLIFSTFCEPGDNILLPLPSYPLFEDIIARLHLEPRFYHLDPEQNWDIDLDLLDSLHDTKTAFLVLISPNNPTGATISEAQARSLGRICKDADMGIIHDEVFSEFLYAGAKHQRPAMLCPDVPVFTLNGISKLFASPDLKLAWIAISGPRAKEHATQLELANDTFLSCNSLSQAILPELFSSLGPFVRAMVATLSENRKALLHFTSTNGTKLKFSLSPPSGGIHFVLLLDPSHYPSDEELATTILSKYGLYLHPGYYYGLDEHCALVLSLLKIPTEFSRGLAILGSALGELCP